MSRLVPLGAACLAAAALGVFLISSLHPRAANGSVTGDQAAGLPNSAAPSAQLLAAQAAVRAHPRGPDAYIALGNAYFASGLIAAADDSYQTALQLDPRRPEAPTLHAMMLGSLGRGAQARAVLGQVERAHPGYARAWLLDGLISSGQHQYGQAIAAWRRFLALSPRSALTVQVRKLIAGAERAQRSGK